MRNGKRGRYTLEFKQEAVRLVESGRSIAAAALVGRRLTNVENRLALQMLRTNLFTHRTSPLSRPDEPSCRDVRSASEPTSGASAGRLPLLTAAAAPEEQTALPAGPSIETISTSAPPKPLDRCCSRIKLDST